MKPASVESLSAAMRLVAAAKLADTGRGLR